MKFPNLIRLCLFVNWGLKIGENKCELLSDQAQSLLQTGRALGRVVEEARRRPAEPLEVGETIRLEKIKENQRG